jgi:hypothetical protein
MSREPGHFRFHRDPPDHLRPRPQGQRLGPVAPRLRQEQRAAGPAEPRTVPQVVRQQQPGRRRIRHYPFPPGLGRLRPHPDRPVRRIQVIGAQRAQLFPPQRRVIGQREHHPVADLLGAEDPEHLQPLGFTWDPRQLDHPRHQWPGTPVATEPAAGRIGSAPDRVGVTDALLDHEVVKQPHRYQPLLQRGVRQPSPGIQRHHIPAAPARPGPQLADEPGNMSTGRRQRVDAVALARLQVLGKTASIRIDRPRRPPQVSPDPQPLSRPLVPPQNRPLASQRRIHPRRTPVPIGLRGHYRATGGAHT